MSVFNPNCKHYDKFGSCNHPKRKGRLLKKSCILPDEKCQLQEEYPRPILKPASMKRMKTITISQKLLEDLKGAIEMGLFYLPDSHYYKYCWEECTNEEQEKVKEVKDSMNKVLEKCKKIEV